MSTVSNRVAIIEITSKDNDQVMVKMPEGDIMISNSLAAAIACRAFENQFLFKAQLDQLVEDLGEFLIEHADKVQRAFLTTQDYGMLFVVVQVAKVYDPDLDDALAKLEWEIARDAGFSLIQLQTQLLPSVQPDSLSSFLSKSGTMELQFHRAEA